MFSKQIQTGTPSVITSRPPVDARILFKYVLIDPQCEYFVPIVYNENYDITFGKLEKLTIFDTTKWGKINANLVKYFKNTLPSNIPTTFLSPLRCISRDELRLVHSERMVHAMETSNSDIADAAEVWPLQFVPMKYLQSYILTPIKWQVAGSILAAREALRHGWSINIGGGFHHASAHKAEGFCFFADITLIMKILWQDVKECKFFILDLDAHQGNGYERDVSVFDREARNKVYIMDVYNADIYPNDKVAKKAINKKLEINSSFTDEQYIELITSELSAALTEFKPNLIIYNAGTDILKGDPLGDLNISSDGIIQRDECVFKLARAKFIPIVMLTSGGYQKITSTIISNSIINLFEKGYIM